MENREFIQKVKSEIREFPGKTAVLYREYPKGQPETVLDLLGDEPVISASTIKVPIMMALFSKVREEKGSLQEKILVKGEEILSDSRVFEYGERMASLYELAVWMIVNSDNTATNVLISYLGMERLNSYFHKLGLRHTRLERKMLDFQAVKEGKNNFISPVDFCRCMELLKSREKEDFYAALALSILKRNRDPEALCRYLYEDVKAAHKTGGLDGIEHDAGFLEAGETFYFLGVFVSEFEGTEEKSREAQKLIGRISRIIFESQKQRPEY